MRFSIEFSGMRLYNGKLSVWASIKLNKRTFFLSRWDTARVDHKPRTFFLSRRSLMTWYVGTFAA